DSQKALAKILPQLETEIVKRSDRTRGFVVLPRRWVVERTFAWLNRCRRLAKDWENLNRNALAFLRLASIRLMLPKLCNPASCFRADSSTDPEQTRCNAPCAGCSCGRAKPAAPACRGRHWPARSRRRGAACDGTANRLP